MILDAEGAVIDYLTDNAELVVGNGNYGVVIHRHSFPDDAADTAVMVFLELSESHGDVSGLRPASIRITTRSSDAKKAFYLMQNVDLLLDLLVRKNFNDDVECCLSRRNSGPLRFLGPNNDIVHYSSLYNMTLRSRS
jgi:hypothetical protein